MPGGLRGVGDRSLGEWLEASPTLRAVHLRRRLTVAEQESICPPVLDVRGTAEGERRYAAVLPYLPAGWPLGVR